MNLAIIIGRKGSKGLPGKNILKICGRAAVEYPMLAARGATRIDHVVVSTNCSVISEYAEAHNIQVISRPLALCSDLSSPGQVFQQALQHTEQTTGRHAHFIVLLYANAVNVLPEYIDGCMDILESDAGLDSAVTVAEFNMFSPIRARRIEKNGNNTIFIDSLAVPVPMSHDRTVLGNCYFMTAGAQVVRRQTLLDQDSGSVPYPWLGHRIGTLVHDFGFDIDTHWQVPVAEYWLRRHGYTENSVPFSVPKSPSP